MKRVEVIFAVLAGLRVVSVVGLAFAIHNFAMRSYDAHVELQRIIRDR